MFSWFLFWFLTAKDVLCRRSMQLSGQAARPRKLMQHANHGFGVGQAEHVHLAFIGRPAGRDYAAPLQRSCNAMV